MILELVVYRDPTGCLTAFYFSPFEVRDDSNPSGDGLPHLSRIKLGGAATEVITEHSPTATFAPSPSMVARKALSATQSASEMVPKSVVSEHFLPGYFGEGRKPSLDPPWSLSAGDKLRRAPPEAATSLPLIGAEAC